MERLHEPQLFRFVHAELLHLPPDGLQRVKCRAVVFQLFFIAGKRVEISQVVFLVKELLRIVLAVDVDEPCA